MRRFLSFFLLILLAFINVPREFIHECDQDFSHDTSGFQTQHIQEDCTICDFSYAPVVDQTEVAEFVFLILFFQFETSSIIDPEHVSIYYSQGRAPPVLA
ncbi:hypothetical protein N9A49_06450 [Salibacteraceae bacterium]|nr:hypothetical protein [Salibacteraceae bacterium]